MLTGIKRLIGRKWEEQSVQQDIKLWPFKVVNEGGRPKVQVTHQGAQRSFYPEEISSMVLDCMKKAAEAYLGKTVHNAVVTVPAYFNDSQRQATKDAAAIARLNVLRIINEPTAAALAYGLDQPLEDERNVLIFDLGGGTFDVSVLCIEEGIFEVKSTAGDTHLGGEDFDALLTKHFAEEFKRRNGLDLTANKRAVLRLRAASERAKRMLSSASEASVELDSLHEGKDFQATLSRARFEEICGEVFQRTLGPVRQALADAKLSIGDISEIVLVGGSTRIPKVQALLRELFAGRELTQTVNPDEAVAAGAAAQAALLDGDASETITDLVLLDVTPLSLGISVYGDIMSVIMPRNTPIPAKMTVSKYTTVYDYQTEVDIRILEGERKMTKDNNLLGKFLLTGLPKMPRGGPKIAVTFEIDTDGIMQVSAVEQSSNRENKITIVNDKGRLSKEQIEKLVKDAETFQQDDERRKETAESRNQLEHYCISLKSRTNANHTLSSSIKQTITSKCEETQQWMSDHPNATLDEYKRKKRDLELLCDLVFMQL